MNPRVHKATVVLSVLGSMGFTCWLFEFLAKRKNSRRVYDEEDSIHEQVEENNQRNNEGIESTSPVNVTSDTVLLICEFGEGTSWNDINLDQNSGKRHITDVIETCGLKKARKAIMQSSSNSGAKKAMTSTKMQSWSDLPVDIINFIVERLNYIEQIRCRAVCKSWRSNIYDIKYPDKMPWVMSFIGKKKGSSTTRICYLYDPYHKWKHTIENKGEEWEIFVGAYVCASKHGWVLFTKTRQNGTSSLFFYSPFVNKIMKLPELQGTLSYLATFSTTPDSLNCVVFVLHRGYKELRVYKCSPGDKTWTVMLCMEGYYGIIERFVYVEGVLYFAFLDGVMGAFKVDEQHWKIYPYPLLIEKRSLSLIESHDGNLLLSVFDFKDDSSDRVFLFDGHSELNWFEVESLNDRSLFLGDRISISIPVTEEISKVANTIHYDLSSFYFLRGRRRYSCPQVYRWIKKEREGFLTFWIQTPRSR